VRLHPTVLQVFFAGQLIRTVHAAAPRRWSSSAPTDPIDPNHDPQPPRDVSTITRNQTRKHQPELDTPSPPSHHEHQPEQGHRAAQGAGGLVPPGRLEVLPVAQLGHPDRGPAQGAGTQRPLAPSRGWRGARLRRITPPGRGGRLISTLTRGPTVTIAVMEWHDRSSSGPPRRPAVRPQSLVTPPSGLKRGTAICGWRSILRKWAVGQEATGSHNGHSAPRRPRTQARPGRLSRATREVAVSALLRQGLCRRGCTAAVPARSGSKRASGRRCRLGPTSTARVLLRMARSVRRLMRSTYSSSRLTCRYRSR